MRTLEIFGRQPRVLADLGQHRRSNLRAVVKGEGDRRPALTHEAPMRALLAGHAPANAKQSGKDSACLRGRPGGHLGRGSGSEGHGHQGLGVPFAMRDFVGEHGECERLRLRERVFLTRSVDVHTRELIHRSNPTPISLAVKAHGENHRLGSLAPSPSPGLTRAPRKRLGGTRPQGFLGGVILGNVAPAAEPGPFAPKTAGRRYAPKPNAPARLCPAETSILYTPQSSCQSTSDCCGDVSCVEGTCCKELGKACATHADCCAGYKCLPPKYTGYPNVCGQI